MIVNKLVSAYEGFSFRILSQLVRQDADKNVFISPMSVAIALAMTYNGAEGKTAEAIANVLGLDGLSLQEINAANQWLLSIGNNLDPKNPDLSRKWPRRKQLSPFDNPYAPRAEEPALDEVQVTLANSLWAKQGIPLNDNFVQRLRNAYQCEVANLDYAQPEAAATINRWVAEKTQEKIKELVEPAQLEQAILVLINAIYFKGIWSQQFDKERTKERPFTRSDGSVRSHPMMSQSGQYLYYETEEFQAVNLPYGDGRVSMYLFLPTPSSSIEQFQTLLTVENWQRWMVQFDEKEGAIMLPRFTVEYGTLLNDSLTALGMGEAFSNTANFAGMGEGDFMISKVIHKAVIEVNEEGTEAAAATMVEMARGGGFMSQFSMIVDRPFFHAMRDNQTGALLFTGFVLNPAAQ